MNLPDNCVSEWISGFIRTHKDLVQLHKYPVLFRADLTEITGKVAILSGGGAGHEPTHAGYIGRGLLTGVIIGQVFTSPPPTGIYAAIQAVNEYAPSGILLIVQNYTGDRINFGLAQEWSKECGIKVEMMVVADDCATLSNSKVGRRGIAGTLYIHKIAGAMAESGEKLENILSFLQEIGANMVSLGACLDNRVLPTNERYAHQSVKIGEMDIGVGIHGEAGVNKMKYSSIKDVVKIMMNHLTTSPNGLRIDPQKENVSFIVNNLGGLSNLDLGIIAHGVHSFFALQNVNVVRTFVGTFMTSLHMHGVSISILRIPKTPNSIVDFLDLKTSGVAPFLSLRENSHNIRPLEVSLSGLSLEETSPGKSNFLTLRQRNLLMKCVRDSCHILVNNYELLNTFDTEAGDGDCGSTLKRGAEVILTIEQHTFSAPSVLFHNISSICSNVMGGTSGGIFSILFTILATNLKGILTLKSFSVSLLKAIKMVKIYGNTSLGDRTLIDVLEPACQMLLTFDEITTENLGYLLKTATNNSNKTIQMVARVGRASYVNSSVIKHPDPGAHAISLVISACVEVFLDTLKSKKPEELKM